MPLENQPGGPCQVQRLTCYRTAVVEATPGGRANRMQRMRPRPREPDCGPATGAPRPRTLSRGRLTRARPRIREPEGRDAVGTAATALRRDRRLQGHPRRLPAPPGREGQGGHLRQRPAGATPRSLAWADRHAEGRGRPLLHGGHRPVLRGARHPPGRRRPARQRRQPDPHQVRRAGPGPGQQDRPGRRRADRRVRRPRAPAGVAAPVAGSPGIAGAGAADRRPGRDGRPGEGPAGLARADRRGPPVGRRAPCGSWRGRRPGSGPRPTRWSRLPRALAADRELLESIPGVGRPDGDDDPGRAAGGRAAAQSPSRRPRTAGCRRGSSGAARA